LLITTGNDLSFVSFLLFSLSFSDLEIFSLLITTGGRGSVGDIFVDSVFGDAGSLAFPAFSIPTSSTT